MTSEAAVHGRPPYLFSALSAPRAKIRALGLAFLVLMPPLCDAGEGLFLTWNDCHIGSGASATRAFACDSEAGQHVLVCAVEMGTPVDSVLGVEVVIDVQHGDATLPDWWEFGWEGCQADELKADVDFGSACTNVWPPQVAGGLLSYTVGAPRGGSNQARIRAALSVLSSQALAFNTGEIYYAARVVIANTKTLSCLGCSGTACLVLNSIILKRPLRPPGAPTGDVTLTTPGAGNGNWARWQGVSAGDCQAVPVRNRTWGQVKALFR